MIKKEKEIINQNLINDFVARLTRERGLDNLEAEVISQIKTDLADRVSNKINAAIIEKMPIDKLTDFESLLDTGTSSEVQDFCATHVPNLNSVVAAALADFADSYLK
ncbi:MAG: DUF5663 domain-containing protein [Candidatus Komeilibacteria bacterium]|nr:DUF5663 domain-containing protein [Candidatus Komeilibacteria bacterium]